MTLQLYYCADVIAQGVELCLMVIAVAECGVDHHQALGEMADIQFVGQAHTAVQLDRLAEHQLAGTVHHHFQCMDRGGRIFSSSVKAHTARYNSDLVCS